MDGEETSDQRRFLPPEPGGREPDLEGGAPRPEGPQPAHSSYGGYAPPEGHDPSGQPAGAWQGQGQPDGPGGQPHGSGGQPYGGGQPGWGGPAQGWSSGQGGWGGPPPGQPPGWQATPPPWAYQPQPQVPDNGPAVAGFVLSIVAAALLLMSAGLSSIVSVVCSGLGILYSRRGRGRVDRGETPKHRGLAQAGFVTGIIALVLSVLATAFWILILVLAATSEDFRRDFENDLRDPDGFETSMRAAVTALGTLGRLVS